MSRNANTVKLMGSSKSSTRYHVGTFTFNTQFQELQEPVKMFRKPQSQEPKKQTTSHRFGYEPPVVNEKNLPIILEDGAKNTTTGVYEDAPGDYVVIVREGNVMRAYPVTSWFKFGATKSADLDFTQPIAKPAEVNQQILKKLGSLAKSETPDPASTHSRLRATRESRFSGATEDGNEAGEEMDFEEEFANDEGVGGKEDEEPEEVVPKKLSKDAKKRATELKGASDSGGLGDDGSEWVYEVLYGDSDDEEIPGSDDEYVSEEEETGDLKEENLAISAATGTGQRMPNRKKRLRDGPADEGREQKRQAKLADDEKLRVDRHSVINTLRTAFKNTPTLDAAQMVTALRTTIPNFAIGGASKSAASAEADANKEYWTRILKQVLQEYTVKAGAKTFNWKEKK